MLELKLLTLIIVANGAPIIARKLLPDLFGCPLDTGWRLPDNQPLFGSSKTVRGVVAALLITPLVGLLFSVPLPVSLMMAFFAMTGDLLSSFIKRRLGKKEGAMMLGLDQIPEALLPLLAVRSMLDLSLVSIVIIVSAFFVLELLLSRILYKLKIRKHPH